MQGFPTRSFYSSPLAGLELSPCCVCWNLLLWRAASQIWRRNGVSEGGGWDQNVSWETMCFLPRFTHFIINIRLVNPEARVWLSGFCFVLGCSVCCAACLELSDECCEPGRQWVASEAGMKQETKDHTEAACRRQDAMTSLWHLFSLGDKSECQFMRMHRSNFPGMFKKFSVSSGRWGGSYLDIQMNS